MATNTPNEMVPGMREQGKGIKCYVEHDFAPLKACLVGNLSAVWVPDPDMPEIANLIHDNVGPEAMDYWRKHRNTHLKDSDPERWEKMLYESDALASTLRQAGVRVIRNETGKTPDDIINYETGWGGNKQVSPYVQGGGEVIGHCLVVLWDVSAGNTYEMQHREAINEIMENDPEAVWLTMPAPVPSKTKIKPRPFTAAGDVRIMPGKIVVLGIGVADPSHIQDRTKPRSSGDEFGARILRSMLEPFGWRVETVYFDSHLSYHVDCVICLIDEGLIGMQKGALWTPLPREFKDWEVIEIDPEEQKMGVCNSIPLGGKRVIITEGANKLARELEKRGYTPIEVPYVTNYTTFGSGLHCSILPIWREY